ncbi:tryptophan synthase subunit alpha [Curtobacterium luteum]|uniref:tryptophan synthase subunit alpha n=1 Tax=Curtobacterium luteum TaxID=33881 RepID=UPI00381FFDCC
MAESRRTGRSLEVLRAEAAEEISMLVEHRSRQGEDPWDFMPTLPTVDEQVVLILRADSLELDAAIGARSAQWSMHPASGQGTSMGEEYHRLRRIAMQHPELTAAVWKLIGALPDVG